MIAVARPVETETPQAELSPSQPKRRDNSVPVVVGGSTPDTVAQRNTLSVIIASAQCFSRAVSTLQDEDALDTAFLDTLSAGKTKAWFSDICISDRQISFKIDTGAQVIAVSTGTWQLLGKQPLQTPDKRLLGPAQHPLEVLGHFKGHLSYKGKESTQHVFVVNNLETNLLRLPALNLAARVETTSLDTTTVEKRSRRSSLKSSRA